MTTEQSQLETFETKVKTSLDESVVTLDKETQLALMSIRQKALKQQRQQSRLNLNAWDFNAWRFNAWIPVGTFALCTLLTVLIVYSPDNIDDSTQRMAAQQSGNHDQYEQIAMLELFTNPEDLETTSDPDFYVWMDEILASEDIDNAV
jgi:hypothetical protein